MTNDYRDSCGIAFADHRLWLPASASDFPHVDRKLYRRKDVTMTDWHAFHQAGPCWWCGWNSGKGFNRRVELHHMARYDLACCWAMLCEHCHRIDGCAVTSDALGRLLFCKWRYDRKNTSWVHLAICMGRFLPDLITEK